jgi:hypothetical protein
MNDPESVTDMGPLPESDDNAELQRRSFKALCAFLEEQDTIVFRDERIEDYGVDGSFELNLEKRMTNFRAQVQLKGTASIEPNKDGTMSLSVKTANLNYLLNGPSPVYILFDVRKRQFWYLWAQEENRRLEIADAGRKKQEKIVLRFRDRLTSETLNTIIDRVRREGRMHRQIHDSLARATTSEPIVVKIDQSSLRITDPSHARDVLMASGPAIVAAGYAREALDLARLLDSEIRDLPRIHLTAGYAEYMVGKHYNALGHIRQAISRSKELSERDRSFLNTLKDACEFHVGIIDGATYQQRMSDRAAALTGLESFETQQDALYHRFLSERNEAARASLVEQIHAVTNRILEHKEATDAIKLGARLILLYVEGTEANLAATHEAGLASLHAFMFRQQSSEILGRYRVASDRLADWEGSSEQALKDAYQLGHPILIAEALGVVLSIRIGNLFDNKSEALSLGKKFEVPEKVKSSVHRQIENALLINGLSGSVERRLRLKRLQADFLEITGDIPGAKEIAALVYPEADAMGFVSIAKRAKELLDDRTLLMEFERNLASSASLDQDILFAHYSDAELKRFSDEVLRIVGSPPARSEVVQQYCDSLREIARERCNWCRHLQILEDLTQTDDPAIAFHVLPNRSCFCDKFKYRTQIETTDAKALIVTFKQLYCTNCAARSPKQG